MDLNKWLKRAYPLYKDEILKQLGQRGAEILKNGKPRESGERRGKYLLGRLVKNISRGDQKYKKGRLIIFKRSNPVRDYNYPLHHGEIKADPGVTASGYHSFYIMESDIIEIIKTGTKTKED